MNQQQTPTPSAWDRAYEFKVVALMTIGFGLVGLDRFIINPLFPVIQKELNLNYQDLGLISGILALAWGIASVFSGPLSDRYGRKRVLVPAELVFSLLRHPAHQECVGPYLGDGGLVYQCHSLGYFLSQLHD